MTIEQMREYVSKMYPSDKWKFRVKTMPDNQIIAVYHRLKEKPPKVKKDPKGEHYEQLSMDI